MRTGTPRRTLAPAAAGVLLLAAGGCSPSSGNAPVTSRDDTAAAAGAPIAHELPSNGGSAPDASAADVPDADGNPGGGAAPDAGGEPEVAPVPRTYVAAARAIVSRGVARSFLLATPTPMPPGAIPLVFALHGDGGTAEGMRAALPLEDAAKGDAVFVYPSAPDGTFPYWTEEGRSAEAAFVTDVVSLLHAELGIDTRRVFLSGFSGGATMANALACVLGESVVRGVGVHSGTLYPVTTPSGPMSCTLPGAAIVWGTADTTYGTTYPEGERTRDRYRSNLACSATSTPASTSPCVAYDGCRAPLTWCAIEGHGHAIWSSAASVMWSHFASMR